MKKFLFNLEQLKIIQTLKNEGNLATTAKVLYLSQPALSFHIKNLEQTIDSKIWARKKKRIYFTPEGELVLDYAKKILDLCEEIDKAILYLKKFKKIRLRVGSDKSIGKSISLKIVELFSKRYSYNYVELIISCTQSISWEIINGKIDIGIVQEESVPKNLYNSLYITPYFKDKTILIVPRNYEQKFPTNINISKKELYNLNFIATKPYLEDRKPIDKILKKFNNNQNQLKINLELNSVKALKRAVQDGFGVSFLSAMLVKEELYSKIIHSLPLEDLNNDNQFIIILNRKNNESYLSIQFYNYCLAVVKPSFYSKFLNLDYLF